MELAAVSCDNTESALLRSPVSDRRVKVASDVDAVDEDVEGLRLVVGRDLAGTA